MHLILSVSHLCPRQALSATESLSTPSGAGIRREIDDHSWLVSSLVRLLLAPMQWVRKKHPIKRAGVEGGQVRAPGYALDAMTSKPRKKFGVDGMPRGGVAQGDDRQVASRCRALRAGCILLGTVLNRRMGCMRVTSHSRDALAYLASSCGT